MSEKSFLIENESKLDIILFWKKSIKSLKRMEVLCKPCCHLLLHKTILENSTIYRNISMWNNFPKQYHTLNLVFGFLQSPNISNILYKSIMMIKAFRCLPKSEAALHKKWSFPLRMSSVNVTKSAVSCGFGHIYWRNP